MESFKLANLMIKALAVMVRWWVSWLAALVMGIAGAIVHRRLINRRARRIR